MIESKKVKFDTIKLKSGSLAWWQLVQQKRMGQEQRTDQVVGGNEGEIEDALLTSRLQTMPL